MACKLVTCPESAHLEMIVYAKTPLGLLVEACTRFRPDCPMTCPRTCAALLDRKHGDHDDTDAMLDVGDDTSIDLRLP